MWKLLTIDDEPERTEQIADWFQPAGFQVLRAHSGKEGLRKAKETQPNVILLDIAMSEMDGHEVLMRLKRDPSTARIPVVIWSFKAEELDGLQALLRTGLREGADYIVAKKWGFPALQEVVEKLLRKADVIQVSGHELKLGEGCVEVWVDGSRIELANKEATVLAFLNSQRNKLCDVCSIARHVYGSEDETTKYSVRRIIERIRKKIEPNPKRPIFIVNMRGFGYKLVDTATSS